MKKYFFVSLIALCVLVLNGCKKDQPECKYHVQTLDLTVAQPDWQFDKEAQQYYYHFDVPELTTYVYNYGNWTVCREYNYNTPDAYQVALPESKYLSWVEIDPATKDTTNSGFYTQHIDYRVGIEYVEVQLTVSDYIYSDTNPEDMHFRLQLIY